MNGLTDSARRIVAAPAFQKGVLALIVAAGILAGVETDRELHARWGHGFRILDLAIVTAFTAELALRILALGRGWPGFFRDPWNLFDFVIVALCWLPAGGVFAGVLRLARVLRVLRLIPQVPQLQILVGALLKSIPPMSYIALLLGLLFYIYAVLGVSLFGRNDPLHFGSLPKAMLSLFQVSTLEDWSMLLKIQMLGSGVYGYEGHEHLTTESVAQPAVAVIYFITFIMLGTMIVLNLLIGVVVNSMTEARLEAEKAERERHQSESGRPTVLDEMHQAEEQLAALQKQLHSVRSRLRELGDRK